MQRRYLFTVLVLLLLGISLGYALLSTNLNIVGTTVVKDNKWDIYFDNVQVKSGSVTASTPAIDTAKTTVSYSVTLNLPGDYFEFTVDAVNDGTIDGMISEISSTLNNVEIDDNLPPALEYNVTYVNGTTIQNNQLLEAGEKETYKVKVGYKKDISATDLPSTEQTLNLTFSVTYIQADDSVIPVDHSFTVYTVNMGDYYDQDNTWVRIGHSIPTAITQYSTPQEAMAAFNNRPFFLKHKIENNVVTESYVGFIITEEMANNNPGMTAGTYAIRGLDTHDNDDNCKPEYYDSVNDKCINPYYEANKEVLLTAFGSSYCTESSSLFSCNASNFNVDDYLNGYVNSSYQSYDCDVDYNGASYIY